MHSDSCIGESYIAQFSVCSSLDCVRERILAYIEREKPPHPPV